MKLSLLVLIVAILLMAGCMQPVMTDTPPAATPTITCVGVVGRTSLCISQTPVPTAQSATPTLTTTPSATETVTPTFTPSATATATLTPTITNTLAPTGTADQVNMFFPPSITVTFDPDNPMQHCFLTFYDATLMPGFLGVWRRDKGGYFDCVAKEQ